LCPVKRGWRFKLIDKEAFIRFLMDEQALRFGTFTLKSGLRSPFFINIGAVCSGSGLNFLGQAVAQKIHDEFGNVQIVFGPPYKGIAMVTAAAVAWQNMYGNTIYTLYNRKEAKGHGERGLFVGKEARPGDKIVLVDDVLTTGGTKVEAIQLLERTFNVQVAGIVVAVDRRTKGTDAGLGQTPFVSIMDLKDLIAFLRKDDPAQAETLQKFYEGNYE